MAVLGARGKTGRLIVKGLLAQGKKVRAVSYQPFKFEDKVSGLFACSGVCTREIDSERVGRRSRGGGLLLGGGYCCPSADPSISRPTNQSINQRSEAPCQ